MRGSSHPTTAVSRAEVIALVAACVLLWTSPSAMGQCAQWLDLTPGNQVPLTGLSSTGQRPIAYDSGRGRVVCLVGHDPNNPGTMQVYEWNGAVWNHRTPTTASPPPLRGYCVAYDSSRGVTVLYGGIYYCDPNPNSDPCPFNDVWEWDGAAWRSVTIHTSPWPSLVLANGTMTYDSVRGRCVLVRAEDGHFGDTWEWDGTHWEQTVDVPSGDGSDMNAVFDTWRNRVVLRTVDSNALEVLWAYTRPPGTSGSWQYLPIAAPRLQYVQETSLAFDPLRGRVLRIGGYAYGPSLALRSVSQWDDATSSWIDDQAIWLPPEQLRSDARVCFDSGRDRLVVFGGMNTTYDSGTGHFSTHVYNDTLELARQSPAGILTQPSSATVCQGQAALFAAALYADGSAVQWYHEGQPVPGASSSILSINPAGVSDEGSYVLRLSNACGVLDSLPATLTVHTPPGMTGPVTWPIITCPGFYARIIPATSTGTAPITIALQKFDGTAWADVPGMTTTPGVALEFPALMHSDTGLYRLRHSNPCGTIYSDSHYIQVGVTFSQQPANVTSPPCDTAHFFVLAGGYGSLRYQWRHGGAPVANEGARVFGATTSELTITGARYEDEGDYDCLVTDDCETRACNAARLTLPTPVWARKLADGPWQRSSSDMAYDPVRHVSVIYGGLGPRPGSPGFNYTLNDTWEWDGYQWTQRFPPHDPHQRSGHVMAFDTNRNLILVFGGMDTVIGRNNEVWGYDGSDWTLLSADTPSGPPTNSIVEFAVFDIARAKLVVMTSVPPAQNGYFSNTWEFDSATLTWSLAYSGSAIGYYYTAFAYDSVHNYTVGQSYLYPNPAASAFTATWDGVSWMNAGVTTPDRTGGRMAFDTTRRRTVLYGCCRGLDTSLNTTETWAFDGAAWQLVLPGFNTTLNDAVIPFGLVYDTARRAMVMVGKDYPGSFGEVPMQTWEYRYLDRIAIDHQPAPAPLVAGQPVNLSVAAAGAGVLGYQWRKDGSNLSDGPSTGGGTISGAGSPTLTISPAAAADGGRYDCVMTNACGSVTSAPARIGCAADFNGSGSASVQDIFDFLAAWFAHDPRADINGSGTVTVQDIFDFLAAWFAGC